MNIPERGREKVVVRRLCLHRELTTGARGFHPGLRRSARSGPTGLHPHTGTEHRYWSSARMGEGREVTCKAGAFYNRSPALCQDIYLTDGADATQRARAECVLVRDRFVFAWKHFTLQTVALNSALWQHELISFWLILQWFKEQFGCCLSLISFFFSI